MQNKYLSIIVPIYNGEKQLDRLLESMTDGDVDGLEIILINDGSKDRTETVCLRWQEKFPGVIRYLLKENGGVSAARNWGIDNAYGRYLGFADHDDYFAPGAVQYLLAKAKDPQTNADMILYEPVCVDIHGNKRRIELPVASGIWTGENLLTHIIVPMVFGIKDERGHYFNFGVWNCLIRTTFIKECGIHFDPYLRMGEDITYLTQAVCSARIVETDKKELYNYLFNSSSATRTYVKSTELSITKTKYIYRKRAEAMSRYPEELWMPYIHVNYASIIGSFARNWAHPQSGENIRNTVRRVKEIYRDPEIAEHVSKATPTYAQGKRRLECRLIVKKHVLLLVLYFRALHFYTRLRDNRQSD